MNVDHVTTSFYHPEANAKVERFHRTLRDILAKKLDDNLATWDMYLNQALAAVRFSVSESTGFSHLYLIYSRDPVLPIDNILTPRRKYLGDEARKIALQQQHMSFAVVQNKLRKEKKRQRKYVNKNRKLVTLKVGDSVYLKRQQRRSKLENKLAPFYRVVEKLSPVTYLVKISWTELPKSLVEHLRLAPIGDREIPRDEVGRPMRKAVYLVPPSSSSSDSEGGQSDGSDKDRPLDRRVRRFRQERSGSSEEEDIPLAELRRRVRARNRRLRAQRNVNLVQGSNDDSQRESNQDNAVSGDGGKAVSQLLTAVIQLLQKVASKEESGAI